MPALPGRLPCAALAIMFAAVSATAAPPASDEDDPRLPLVTVEAVQGGSESGPTPAVWVVRRSGDLNDALTVRYVLTGSATPGEDYVPPAGEVTLGPGKSSARIEVAMIDDAEDEPDESLTVWLRPGPYRVPPANAWEEPPAVPPPLADLVARLRPAVRERMAPLAYAGSYRLDQIVGYHNRGGMPATDFHPPEPLTRAVGPFWDRGCEAVLDTGDRSGVWTLSRPPAPPVRRPGPEPAAPAKASPPAYRLARYLPDGHSPFDVVEITCTDGSTRLLGTGPQPAHESEVLLVLTSSEAVSELFVTRRVPLEGMRRSFDTYVDLAHLCKQQPALAREYVHPLMMVLGAGVPPQDAYTYFPEIAADPAIARRVEALLADMDCEDFRRRESASRELAALGDEAALALVRRLRQDPPLSPEQDGRVNRFLWRVGWPGVTGTPSPVGDEEGFLRACLYYRDVRVREAAARALARRAGPAWDGQSAGLEE